LVLIKEALKGLVALILLAGFLELLLPDDQMRKYGQMVVGLIVLFSLINMLGQIGRDFSFKWPEEDGLAAAGAETLVTDGLELRRRGEEEAAQLNTPAVQAGVEEFLQQITGSKEVRVQLRPTAEKAGWSARVIIPDRNGVPVDFLKRTVAALLSIRLDQVEVEGEDEGES
jgi:stage III sporulation protein AF